MEIDNHRLMYHPERVVEWIKKGDCYPIYVEVGPTNNCNHRCSFCALDFVVGKGKIEYIDPEVMKRNLIQMGEKGVKSIMFAGEGEPLLHRDIGTFVKTAKNAGMDASMTTNGTAFNEGKISQCMPYLSWIRFSIDSGSPEVYSIVHGIKRENFDKLKINLQNAVNFRNEHKLKITIGTQFLVLSSNINDALKLAEILNKIGVDNLQIKPYSHHPDSSNNFVVSQEQYNQLEKKLQRFNSNNFQIFFRKETIERINSVIPYSQCYGSSFFALIDAKGNVLPCNLFYGKEDYYYGNLNQNTFQEIWEGEKRKGVLEKLKKINTRECRLGCRLDVINRYLHRLKNPEIHDNFI